jgi:hypothetical protein
MNREIILAVTLILCSTAAWGAENNTSIENDPVLAALKDVIMSSSSNLTSYRFTMDADQTMTLVNLTDQREAPQVVSVKSFGAGSMNVTEKAMKMAMASVVIPIGDDNNVTANAIEEYLINDTVYMKMDGNWTLLKLSLPNDWSSQDTAGEQMEVFNQSQISLLGVETVDGLPCYKIGIVQDMAAFSQVASEQNDLALGLINLSELYENSTMDLIYWIDMNENMLRKMEMTLNLSVNLQDLGIPSEETGDTEMQMSLLSTYLYRDINENIQIVLPLEAETAKPLLSLLNMTNEAMPENSSAVNLSAINQSTINSSTINQSVNA